MELNSKQQTCIECPGYGGIRKRSEAYVRWVIYCTTKKEDVEADGSTGRSCPKYGFTFSLGVKK